MSEAIVEKKRGISPVWILPLLAICLGGWLLFKSYRDAGIDITLHVQDSSGITVEKTAVMFKGNKIGMVKQIDVSDDLLGVDLTIEMNKITESHLVEDLKFWVEKIDIEAGKITGLDTLLSGSYIGLQPGISDKPSRKFIALPHKPPISEHAPGLHLKLHAQALHSLQIGSGIYHKNIEIGSVQQYALQGDDTVLLDFYIKPKYQNLVKKDTRFWNASGITISGGITGLKVHVASLASIFRGGIMMQTPAAIKESPQAENGQLFTLYDDFAAAEYGIPLTLELTTGVGMKKDATKIMYRGMEIGFIKKFNIKNNKRHTVTAHVLLDPRAETILRETTVFYLVQPEISLLKMRNLETIVTGSYITFIPGEGKFKDHFMVKNESPPQKKNEVEAGALEILLTTKDLGSITVGSPILYRKVEVGKITGFELRQKEDDVLLTGVIGKQYTGLLQTTSRFYNLSGVEVNASLSGITVQTGSLETIVAGGVAFYTPEQGKPAVKNQVYSLYEGYAAAENSDPVNPGDRVITLTARDLGSIKKGSPILYKKVTVGKITGFELRAKQGDVLLTGVVKKEYSNLVKTTSRFYNLSGIEVNAALSGIKIQTGSLETIVSGGVGFYTPGKGKTSTKKKVYPLYDDYEAAENSDRVKITIHFGRTDGLKKGVLVKYHGVQIGEVSKVHYEKNMETITVDAMLERQAGTLLKDKTHFWLVRPEFSLTGTQHLDTLLGGPYIAIAPGAGKGRVEFTALKEEPVIIDERPGLNIVLETENLFSLKTGDHVYYRKVKVGEITGIRLSSTFQKVLLHVIIDKPFVSIIREQTKFWNASGIHLSGGIFSGFSMSTESVEGLMAGGISLATPDNDTMGKRVSGGHQFILYGEAEDSWLKWSPKIGSGKRVKKK